MDEFVNTIQEVFRSGTIWESISVVVYLLSPIILVIVGVHVIHNAWIDYDIIHNGRLERKWHK